MNIIKLNAIDSTNEFLKNLKRETSTLDFTVVSADFQSNGKGQMGTKWESEKGKNLTFSVLKLFDSFEVTNQFYLSFAVSNAVFKVLKNIIPNKLSIKWPNDILSDNFKIAGILIENTIVSNQISDSVIGIGINVNQLNFTDENDNRTSLYKILNQEIDKDKLLEDLLNQLQYELEVLKNKEFKKLKQFYESKLYKKGIPTMFEDNRNQIFLGKIKGVSEFGQLIIELENGDFKLFNLKEIKILKT